jgi:hypothetical protein
MPGLSRGRKVEYGRGAVRKKYRFYGQIFDKTVITAWDVPQKMLVFFAAITHAGKRSTNEKICIRTA